MLKLLPILFFAAVNITQISIFEIDGIFSNGHINAIQRYVNENELKESSLFVIQYNASDVNENSVNELQEILKRLAENDITISLKKCKFKVPSIEFLGYYCLLYTSPSPRD